MRFSPFDYQLRAFAGLFFRLIVVGAIFASSIAAALDPRAVLNFSLGPVVLRPQLELAEQFDSNIFYDGEHEKGDLITYISPGLDLLLGRRDDNYLGIDYGLEKLVYLEHDELSTINHRLEGRLMYRTAKLTISGNNTLRVMTGILGRSLGFFRARPVERMQQGYRYRVAYALSPKTAVYTEGMYDEVDYEQGVPIYDHNTFRLTTGFEYKALAKTAFFGEVHYGQAAIDPNSFGLRKGPHMTFIGGFLGARGAFTEKIDGSLKIGYEEREFSDQSEAPGGMVVESSVTYRMREKTMFSFSYARNTALSVESAGQSYTIDTIDFNWLQRIGRGSWSTQGAASRWMATMGIGYSAVQYEVAKRVDSVYTVSFGLAYRVKLWMTAGASYEWENFTSDATGLNDYSAHRIMAKAVIGY